MYVCVLMGGYVHLSVNALRVASPEAGLHLHLSRVLESHSVPPVEERAIFPA